MKRHFTHDRRLFYFNHIRCPHCDMPMQAEVTGCVHNTSDHVWDANSLDIACTSAECDSRVHPTDTQDLWQPIINRIETHINKHWHFGKVVTP